jgi:hypothetical protein
MCPGRTSILSICSFIHSLIHWLSVLGRPALCVACALSVSQENKVNDPKQMESCRKHREGEDGAEWIGSGASTSQGGHKQVFKSG